MPKGHAHALNGGTLHENRNWLLSMVGAIYTLTDWLVKTKRHRVQGLSCLRESAQYHVLRPTGDPGRQSAASPPSTAGRSLRDSTRSGTILEPIPFMGLCLLWRLLVSATIRILCGCRKMCGPDAIPWRAFRCVPYVPRLTCHLSPQPLMFFIGHVVRRKRNATSDDPPPNTQRLRKSAAAPRRSHHLQFGVARQHVPRAQHATPWP